MTNTEGMVIAGVSCDCKHTHGINFHRSERGVDAIERKRLKDIGMGQNQIARGDISRGKKRVKG